MLNPKSGRPWLPLDDYHLLLINYLDEEIKRLNDKILPYGNEKEDNDLKIRGLLLAKVDLNNLMNNRKNTQQKMLATVFQVKDKHIETDGMQGTINLFRNPESCSEFNKLFNNKDEITAFGLQKLKLLKAEKIEQARIKVAETIDQKFGTQLLPEKKPVF